MSNNLDLSQVSAAQNQKEVTINMQSAQLDAAITAQLDVPIDDGNAKTLTNNEFRRNFLFHVTEDSPAPSGAITLTVPALSRGSFAVLNLTQEDVTVTINGQPLTAPVVAPGDNPALLTCDGVNVRLASSAGGSGSGGFGTSDFNKVVTSLAVPANTAVEFNLSDFFNRGLIHTIKLTETGGTATDPYDLQFFGKDTFLSADMHYSVTGIDPTANGRLFRDDLAVMYKDLDGTDELHVKITNSDTAEAMEFTLEIDAEVFETGIGGGGGDVVGPASAVSGRIATFDGTTGKLIKDSGVTVLDLGASLYGSRGLQGRRPTTTTYTLDADSVKLMNPTDKQTVVVVSPSTVTIDVTTSGPAANGRDQAGAFSASTWLHFYWIWNGTTLAGIVSTSAPPTGPTLPSGYTHWCYATAVRFTGASVLANANTSGNYVQTGASPLVTSGTATSETALDAAASLPPNAQLCTLHIIANHAGGGTERADVWIRLLSGNNFYHLRMMAANPHGGTAWFNVPNINNRTFYYLWNFFGSAPSGPSADVYTLGYSVPNGGV